MKRVLFSHSYFYRLDPKQWRIGEPYPPLMTITAAALLRRDGFEVNLYDVALRSDFTDLPKVLEDFRPDYFIIFDDGFNYLTKMCLTVMREAAMQMQQMARSAGATVLVCSSDSTDHAEKYLSNGADFVIKGEGEITLQEFVARHSRDEEIDDIAGLIFRRNGDLISNPQRPVLNNLDSLPFPAWDLIDLKAYQNIWAAKRGKVQINMATTRGCPYKCNWCAKPIYGQRYNSRSPGHVVDEIEFHVTRHQIDDFWMCDDIFGLKPGWVQEFRDELNRRNLKIKYKIQTRADLLLEEDNLDALVDAGLDEAWIGAESGSQKILDAMEKGTTVAQIRESTRLLKSRGVKVGFFIQFGYLNENREDIDKTVALVLDLMPDRLGVSVSYPLPGTRFYEMVKTDLHQKANWSDSDDLDMMFQNTFPRAFYKRLHRYLHHRYKIKRGRQALEVLLRTPGQFTIRKAKNVASGTLSVPGALLTSFRMNRIRIS